jgi:hypothetical protein
MHPGRTLASIVGAGFAIACSGSSPAPGGSRGTVSGTAHGHTLAVGDALALDGATQSQDASAKNPYSLVALTSYAGICAYVQGATHLGHGGWVLEMTAGASYPPMQGTYAVPLQANALFAEADASCQPLGSELAQGGSITFDAVAPTLLSGTFDLTFSAGDHLTGSFSAPVCDTSLAALTAPTMGCQP